MVHPTLPVQKLPGATYDFNSTVEFGARKLTLSWNRGEDPKSVADRFLRRSAEGFGPWEPREMDDFWICLVENYRKIVKTIPIPPFL